MDAATDPNPSTPPLGVVQETMLITLWARAEESRRPDAIVRDRFAERIADAAPFDLSRFEGGWKSQVGVAVRDRWIDEMVRQFLHRHDGGTIVNLGAGLDTRFLRLGDERAQWFEIDLPDAMAVRRSLIPESMRNRQLPQSGLDLSWIEVVAAEAKATPLLIAEGVLMFFDPPDVRELLDRFALIAPGAELIFDVIGPLMVRWPWLHDTLPRTQARFRWGVRSRRELDQMGEHWIVNSTRSMLDEAPARWRWMRGCRLVPGLRRQFMVVHGRGDPPR